MGTQPSSTRTCLVTGGAGFIGVAISAGLAARFERVVVVDNLHPQVHQVRERPAGLDPRVELVVGDVTDSATWDSLLTDVRPDAVVHLAAETGTGQSLTESVRHTHVNVVGTSQMLDALVRHDATPSRIVLTSSRAVYGEGAWHGSDGVPVYPGQRTLAQLEAGQWDFVGLEPLPMVAGHTIPQPASVYAVTKLTQEMLLRTWAQSYDVGLTVLRLQNVYGPGQSLSNPYTGIMSLFCRLARQGDSIPLYEDGAMLRDFVLIDDVAAALLAAIDAGDVGQTPIDIGFGQARTIADAAREIARYYQAPEPHVCGLYRLGDVRHAWTEVSEAGERLGWTPQYDLTEGVTRLADWIEAQREVPSA